MKYIYVASGAVFSEKPLNPDKAVVGITDCCLISLIGGLRQAEFGWDTIFNTSRDIRKYRELYIEPCNRRLYVDSGGYSFIKGDIRPQDAIKAIGCYLLYLEKERDIYDYIFSLDLPISLKYHSFNTQEKIYRFNRESVQQSLAVMEKYPEIRDRFLFVWHFKMIKQYEVWKRIHSELDLDRYIGGRALGGMVSVRGITGISFSPFIGMSYRCLYDYLAAERFDIPFRLHFLGIYLAYDRFEMAFLEKLFRRYLDGIAGAEFSYDSINYSEKPRRSMKNLEVFGNNDGIPRVYKGVLNIPDEMIRRAYETPQRIEAVKAEMERLSQKRLLKDSNAFIPLYLQGCMDLDRYFEDLIERYRLVEALFNSRHIIRFKYHIGHLLTDQSRILPEIFSKKMIKSVIKNMEITFQFHRWFVDRMDTESLEDLNCDFIRMIEFPDSIQ